MGGMHNREGPSGSWQVGCVTELRFPQGTGGRPHDARAPRFPDLNFWANLGVPCGFLNHLELATVFLILARCSSVSILFHTIYIKPTANV